MVLEDFDGDNVVGAALPAFDHLAECAASEELEHFVFGGQRVEHLMLDELIVAVGAAARTFAGGLRVRETTGCDDFCVRRCVAAQWSRTVRVRLPSLSCGLRRSYRRSYDGGAAAAAAIAAGRVGGGGVGVVVVGVGAVSMATAATVATDVIVNVDDNN